MARQPKRVRSTEVRPPVILPFRMPDDIAPEPRLQVWDTFPIGGRHYQFLWERWDAREAARLPFATIADPEDPGTVLSKRLVDMETGEVIRPLSEWPASSWGA